VNGAIEGSHFNNYGFETNGRANAPASNGTSPNTNGPATMYSTQQGARYGLGIPVRNGAGADSKMNGLHGPKHKRGDMDRECKFSFFIAYFM